MSGIKPSFPGSPFGPGSVDFSDAMNCDSVFPAFPGCSNQERFQQFPQRIEYASYRTIINRAKKLNAECADLGSGEAASLCSLIGVVPFYRDNGSYRGKRYIYSARSSVRYALFMTALSAVKTVKSDNVFNRFYERITARRPSKVDLVAVAHILKPF